MPSPKSSIETRSLPTLMRSLPRVLSVTLTDLTVHLARSHGSVHSSLPSQLNASPARTLDHSHFPVLAPGRADLHSLAALPSTRAVSNRTCSMSLASRSSIRRAARLFARSRKPTAPLASDSHAITSARVDGCSLNPMVNQRSANIATTAIKAIPTGTETADANG